VRLQESGTTGVRRMKVKVEQLGENSYLVVVPRNYPDCARSISQISKAVKAGRGSVFHIRRVGFVDKMKTIDVEVEL